MFSVCEGKGDERYLGIHGWSGDHTTFAPLMSLLPETARFVSVDLPGVGRSGPPDRWSIETIASAICEVIAREGGQDWTVIGSCSGAAFALFTALREKKSKCQGRIRRLVLLDPFASMPIYFRLFVPRNFAGVGRLLYQLSFANPVGRAMVNQALAGKRSDKTDLTRSFQGVNHDNTYDYLRILADSGSVDQFGELDIKTDIIIGGKSFNAVRQSARLFKKTIKDCRVHIVPQAGHLPLEESTTEVAQIIFSSSALYTVDKL